MKRMTILTGVGLTFVYFALQFLFVTALKVSIRDCILSDKEALLTVENQGPETLDKFFVTVKVFEGDRLVSSSPLVEKRNLAQNAKVQIKLSLSKILSKSCEYKVEAIFQSGSGRPISREFKGKILKQTASAWIPGRRFNPISEPAELRKSIKTFDVRSAMGLL